jgi:hypothetical protein
MLSPVGRGIKARKGFAELLQKPLLLIRAVAFRQNLGKKTRNSVSVAQASSL